jgi:hypothetical protein
MFLAEVGRHRCARWAINTRIEWFVGRFRFQRACSRIGDGMAQKEKQFTEEETVRRFEAALRGARAVGPLPMKELPPKRARKGNKKRAPGVNPEPKD